MAQDHYETLGVSKQASQDEIRTAYRQMARKHHPDLNPNDAKAKEKFQRVQEAFDVLNDPQKRKMYDQFGSAYETMGGGAGPRPGAWPGTGGGGAGPQGFEVNFEDLFGGGADAGGGGFADLFKTFKQRNKRSAPTRGSNIEHALTVPFATAVLGGEAEISLRSEDGRTESLRVKIPAGITSGKKIRLRGKGDPSPSGGPPGDILIRVDVAPHPHFRRQGNRLDIRVPITLAEAIGGGKIDVPTPHGTIALTVPPNTSSGSKLRAKGQGVRPADGEPGDLFAEVQIVLPKDLESSRPPEYSGVAEEILPESSRGIAMVAVSSFAGLVIVHSQNLILGLRGSAMVAGGPHLPVASAMPLTLETQFGNVLVAQVSEPTIPEPMRAILLMAILGIILLGLLLIVSTMLGAHWVRRLGEFRRGPAVPTDVTPLRPHPSQRVGTGSPQDLPEEAIDTVISGDKHSDDDTKTPP